MPDTIHADRAVTGYVYPSEWRNRTRADCMAFIADHGAEIDAARGKVAAAAEELGAILKRTGGFERNSTTAESYLNAVLDTVDAAMAEEVREWVNS